MFADRAEAGQRLGVRLRRLSPPLERPIVYALPRGGVAVGAAVAAALGHAPLDLVLVRKIGAPGQPELALGAVVNGAEAETVLNADVVALTGADEAYIARARAQALAEIERRRQLYLAGRPRPDPRGRAAVVVDDGLATGATARAALHALRRRGPARLVLAVPVAPPETIAALRGEADEIVCLAESEIPFGIGGCYADFHQLDDAEVIRLLDAAAAAARSAPEGGGGSAG
ncbi:phosphoribosyltransferase [Caldovatus sp. SYSU G05006]|uniref:Phosphoribosyltransferase n=1 Tax=Caldovatus aquaticus TaxID=2865671 RepID=A0ABS7F1B5_9PROT|nr:phosphoribosyltransferase [Caldovatus aquaticus]